GIDPIVQLLLELAVRLVARAPQVVRKCQAFIVDQLRQYNDRIPRDLIRWVAKQYLVDPPLAPNIDWEFPPDYGFAIPGHPEYDRYKNGPPHVPAEPSQAEPGPSHTEPNSPSDWDLGEPWVPVPNEPWKNEPWWKE